MWILEPVACDYSRQFMITSIFIRDPWHVNVKILISWLLKVYMVVNFKAHGISRGARKLVRTPTLKKIKKYLIRLKKKKA